MNRLDDGFDEILDTRQLINPEGEYSHDINHLKRRCPDMVTMYDSKEFRAIKARLIRIVGKVRAYEIMNNYI